MVAMTEVYHKPRAETIALAQASHRRTGGRWLIPCPAHQGEDLNCSIWDGENGLGAKCWSRDCTYADIMAAVGVQLPEGRRPTSYFKIAEYQHPDGVARPVYRRDYPNDFEAGIPCDHVTNLRNKTLCGKMSTHKHVWGSGSPEGCYLLAWGEDAPDNRLLIVEGEKAALAGIAAGLDRQGYTPVSWRGGTNSAGKVNWDLAKGRNVVLWPDADSPGAKAMDTAGLMATAAGAASVLLVEVTSLEQGADLADIPAASLIPMIEAAPAWDPPPPPALGRPRARDSESIHSVVDTSRKLQEALTPPERELLKWDKFRNGIRGFGKGKHHLFPDLDTMVKDLRVRLHAKDFLASATMVRDGLEAIARENQYHALLDAWVAYTSPNATPDNPTPTLDNAAKYFCQDPTPLDKETVRLMIMGMVARATDPGCEFQFMPILLGESGFRKSTTLQWLAGGRDFFSDDFPSFTLPDHNKLVGERSRGCILMEYQELRDSHKLDINDVKSFVSTTEDVYRSAYGREDDNAGKPRGFITVATTNHDSLARFPLDPAGMRRLPIITVDKRIDNDALVADRPALIAESLAFLEAHPEHRFKLSRAAFSCLGDVWYSVKYGKDKILQRFQEVVDVTQEDIYMPLTWRPRLSIASTRRC